MMGLVTASGTELQGDGHLLKIAKLLPKQGRKLSFSLLLSGMNKSRFADSCMPV